MEDGSHLHTEPFFERVREKMAFRGATHPRDHVRHGVLHPALPDVRPTVQEEVPIFRAP